MDDGDAAADGGLVPELDAGRAGALRALRELKRPESLKPALDALSDPEAAVRSEAISVVGYLKTEEALPALMSMLKDPEASVRRTAAGAPIALG